MDDEDNCGQMVVTNDDLEEGDSYIVRSDSWQGRSTWSRKPAECTIGINLGDRMVGVNLIEWWCDKVYKEPFLDIYDNCDGTRKNLLVGISQHGRTPLFTLWEGIEGMQAKASARLQPVPGYRLLVKA